MSQEPKSGGRNAENDDEGEYICLGGLLDSVAAILAPIFEEEIPGGVGVQIPSSNRQT